MAIVHRLLSFGRSRSLATIDAVSTFSDGEAESAVKHAASEEKPNAGEKQLSGRRRSLSKKGLVRTLSSTSASSHATELVDDPASPTTASTASPTSTMELGGSMSSLGTVGTATQMATGSQIIRRSGSKAEFSSYFRVKVTLADNLKAVTSQSTGEELAARVIGKHDRDKEVIEKEVEMFRALDHQNIARLFELYEDPLSTTLIFESCSLGTLSTALQEQTFSERWAARTLKQIMRAVKFMHDKRICHRGLHPDILRLEDRGKGIQDCKAQVGDLQHATAYQGDGKLKGMVGSTLYSSPQMLLGQSYTKLSDVWSCGAILHRVLCGSAPLEHAYVDMHHPSSTDDGEFWKSVESGTLNTDLWKGVSSTGKAIMTKMLSRNEPDRWAMSECLANKWFEYFGKSQTTDVDLTVHHLESLQAFCTMNKLQKLAIQIIARRMPDAESKPFRELFESIDAHNDGVIDADELASALKKVKKNDSSHSWRLKKAVEVYPTAREFMQALDTNGNGELDMTEFLAATVPRKLYNGQLQKVLQTAFDALDSDGSGEISLAELQEVLLQNGRATEAEKEEIKELLRDADKSGNGELDFEEFMEMMSKTSDTLMTPKPSETPKKRPSTAPNRRTSETRRPSFSLSSSDFSILSRSETSGRLSTPNSGRRMSAVMSVFSKSE